jgi:hypothetical protein
VLARLLPGLQVKGRCCVQQCAWSRCNPTTDDEYACSISNAAAYLPASPSKQQPVALSPAWGGLVHASRS